MLRLIVTGCFTLTYLFAQTIDPSFRVTFESPDVAQAVKLLPDGHSIVAGQLTSIGSDPARIVAKLTPDGALDPSFHLDSRVINGQVSRIDRGLADRLVIQASFTYADGSTFSGVTALLPNGNFDADFTPIPVPANNRLRFTCLPNGNIFVSSSTNVSKRDTHRISLYRANGTMHPGFAPLTLTTAEQPTASSYVTAVGAQSSNELIIAGQDLSYNGRQQDVYRVDSTGRIDDSFNPVVDRRDNFDLHRLAIAEDGQIALYYLLSNKVALLDRDASVVRVKDDLGLQVKELAFISSGELLLVAPDQVAVFDQDYYRKWFEVGNGFPTAVSTYGNTLLCGGLYRPLPQRGIQSQGLLKVEVTESDIQPTTKFAAMLYGPGSVRALLPQANGDLIAIGNFVRVNGTPHRHIVRLHSDGSLDPSFLTSNYPRSLTTAAQLSDGKIITGKNATDKYEALELLDRDGVPINLAIPFPEYTDRSRRRPTVSHLRVDRRDRVFALANPGSPFESATSQPFASYQFDDNGLVTDYQDYADELADTVFSIEGFLPQPDNKLLLYGRGISVQGVRPTPLLRLLEDGVPDPSFQPELPDSFLIDQVALLPSGSIIVAGRLRTSSYVDSYTAYLYKLFPDGQRDASFGGALRRSTDSYTSVGLLQYTTDNLLYLSTNGSLYKDKPIGNHVLLDSSGNISSYPLVDLSGTVQVTAPSTSDHEFYVGGDFVMPDGSASLVRLSTVLSGTAVRRLATPPLTLSPNPSPGGSLTIHLSNSTPASTAYYRIYALGTGQLLRTGSVPVRDGQATLSVHNMAPGHYTIALFNAEERRVGKFIISRRGRR